MISYTEQMVMCRKIREKLIRVLSEHEDRSIRPQVHYIPTTEAVLRAVTLVPEVNTAEKLTDFLIARMLEDLRLSEHQKEGVRAAV